MKEMSNFDLRRGREGGSSSVRVEFIEDGDRRQDFVEGELASFCQIQNYTATAVINIIHTATAVINIGPPAPFPPISLGTSAAIALNNEEVTTIRLLLIYVSLLYKYLFHQSREVSLFVDDVVVCGQFKVIFFFPLV
jgi:hypothetical protein